MPEGADLEVRETGGETRRYRAEYGEPDLTPWGLLPHEISLSGAHRALTLRLKTARRYEPPDEAFQVPEPAGYRRVELSRIGDLGVALFGDGS